MQCDYFGKCGSCTLYTYDYEAQCAYKQETMRTLFDSLHVKAFDFFASAPSHYRARSEFRIWKSDENLSYAMGSMDKKGAVCIEHCPKVEKKIEQLMPKLIAHLQSHILLREKLFAIEFLATSEHLLVTLIYHKPLESTWDEVAKELETMFDIFVIGRSRGVKRVLSQDFVEERFDIEGKTYRYHIIEGGFSQPNRAMNQKMIAWVLSHLKGCEDLLELYCGYGNFTIPLSQKFNKVLATEISKTSIASALINCELNGVTNTSFVRLSAEELTSALKKEREFNRLRGMDLGAYRFSHVFVDPPRSGMDTQSLEFISQFDTIIYISCNPHTLKRDLEVLTCNYIIEHFALFDQFPNTEHIESGVILKKRI